MVRFIAIVGLLVAVNLFAARCNDTKHPVFESQAEEHQRELAPAIEFVEGYLAQHGKLPTQRIFQNWADSAGAHMLVIRHHLHEYASNHGAKANDDYMIGTWTADWYYYYKSWDGKYFDAPSDMSGYNL